MSLPQRWPDERALACEDPSNCLNGPEPHEFVLPNFSPDELGFPCFKQSWEN